MNKTCPHFVSSGAETSGTVPFENGRLSAVITSTLSIVHVKLSLFYYVIVTHELHYLMCTYSELHNECIVADQIQQLQLAT